MTEIKSASRLLIGAFLLAGMQSCTQPGDTQDESDDAIAAKVPVTELDRLSDAIISSPNQVEPYLARSTYLLDAERYSESYDDLKRAMSIDSLDSEVQYNLAKYYFEAGSVGQAKYAYEASLADDPDHTGAMLGLAEIYVVLTNEDRAMEWINKALRVDEQLPWAYQLKGIIYRARGNSGLAKSSLQTASELDPSDPEPFNLLGMTYADERDELALDYYSTVLDIDSMHMEALYNRAYFLQSDGRFVEAISAYELLLRRHPATAVAYHNMAYIKVGFLDDLPGAVSDLTEAVRINPAYVQAYHARGIALEELGKVEDAKADFELVLDLQPNYAPSVEALNRLAQ